MIRITPELSDRIRAALKDQLGDVPLGTILGIHEDGTVEVKWNPDASEIVMGRVFGTEVPRWPSGHRRFNDPKDGGPRGDA